MIKQFIIIIIIDEMKHSRKNEQYRYEIIYGNESKWSYLGYGELLGPMQLTSSVSAFPDKYFSFVSVVHGSVGYVGHTDDFDLTDECTNVDAHIVKIV